MTTSKLFLGIVVLGFVLSLALAQPKDLLEEISTYLEAWQATERFMGAVLVAKGGTVIFEEGYGLADLETGRPNTPHTAFRLGSLSKPLTATAVLQLQEAGRLTLDDAVGAHLPEYPNGGTITLRHLLTHTSGIPDYARFPDYPSYMNSPTTLSGLIDRFKNLPLMFPSGTQFGYSNSNYVLLTAIIEQVSGQNYGAYLQEHVFAPSLMDSSGYGEASASAAKGYRLSDDGYVPASPIDLSVTAGAGGLISMVSDLYAWILALGNEALLNEETLSAMTFPAVPVGRLSSGNAAYYGLGWYVSDDLGRRAVSHHGGVNGFSSHLLWFPEEDAVIIVLSNLDAAPVPEIAQGLAAILFSEPYELPEVYKEVILEPSLLKTYTGRYALAPNFAVTIVLEDGYLYLEADHGPRARLYPFSDTAFFLEVADVTLRFLTDQDGSVRSFVWRQGGRELQGVRLE